MLKAFSLSLLLLAAAARADEPSSSSSSSAGERLNGMVGLWYGPYNGYSFEYDLIAQFFKSKEWMGNFTGPYLMDEAGSESNRVGAGFAMGVRMPEKGTYGFTADFFAQNRWGHFSRSEYGAEAKLSLLIFGVKVGMVEDWKKFFWQVGLSY
ncbi:MAG: hypothetical protein JF616_00950 [Fibrobacteres bacterium]|nr:hypothetical protein [Fibrobacterota bacterium]